MQYPDLSRSNINTSFINKSQVADNVTSPKSQIITTEASEHMRGTSGFFANPSSPKSPNADSHSGDNTGVFASRKASGDKTDQ